MDKSKDYLKLHEDKKDPWENVDIEKVLRPRDPEIYFGTNPKIDSILKMRMKEGLLTREAVYPTGEEDNAFDMPSMLAEALLVGEMPPFVETRYLDSIARILGYTLFEFLEVINVIPRDYFTNDKKECCNDGCCGGGTDE